MKRAFAAMLAALLLFTGSVQALSDDYVLNDQAQELFQGRSDARTTLTNIRFTDVASNHWAAEPIARAGALNLVKGSSRRFSPSGNVTNEEALAFVLRATGYEREAFALTAQLQGAAPEGSGVSVLWSVGYLNLAMRLGLISAMDYNGVLGSLSGGDVQTSFSRTAPATRERIAYWIYMALRAVDATAFDTSADVQAILNYTDWTSISPEYAEAMEAIVTERIMVGSNNRLNPRSAITRAEMARVICNMERIYLPMFGMEKRSGTVGALRDNQYTTTNEAAIWRNIYVRTSTGAIDVLQYNMGQQGTLGATDISVEDAIVFKNGTLGGLGILEENDVIEYIVEPGTGTVRYVQVLQSPAAKDEASGLLYQVDVNERTITVLDADSKAYKYSLISYLLQTTGDVTTLRIDDKHYDVTKLPYGSGLRLRTTGGVVTEIFYVGEPVAIAEIRGIVTENNPQFGYITIVDNNGNSITKSYYEDDLVVEKQEYYDVDDEIGYIDQVFPNFQYDPRDTTIDKIEPGDIVFLRTAANDSSRITAISASTNYTMKYGKVLRIQRGAAMTSFLIEYENKQTAWYDTANAVFTSRDGKPVNLTVLQTGDWVKLLVNEAIIEPGYVMESVKEITIEGDEHFISSILHGSLAGIDFVQKKLILADAETLTKAGWTGYRELLSLSLTGNDAEYYYLGERVSQDYIQRYLRNADVQAYVAMENNYAGERVRKVSFYTDRELSLPADTIISADGAGNFGVINNRDIWADDGTIVVRHGRLVSAQDILVPDYAAIVLNGGFKAAVVSITDAPDTSQIMIARGRVIGVTENRSFKVQSMSVLTGALWAYTPVQREFAIDSKTIFLDADGYVSRDAFIGYTDDSVINKVYNIVVDGSRAAYVVDSAYATSAVRGTIYAQADGTLSLRDATVYSERTGQWVVLSNVNSILTVNIEANTLIGKNNTIVQPSALQNGDQVRVMAASLPALAPGMEVGGVIIMVEK